MEKFLFLLTKYKIIAEVFYYVIIGGAGLLFSVLQIRIYNKQKQLQTELNQMEKSKIQPLFRISTPLHKITSESIYDTEFIQIFNEGNICRDIRYNIKTFYKVEFTSHKENRSQTVFYFPIEGYYFALFSTGDSTGKIAEGVTHGNNELFGNIYQDAVRHKVEGEYIFVDRVSLVEITYIDINDELHTVYFRNKERIKKGEYMQIIDDSKKMFDYHTYDVKKITFDMIREFIYKQYNN